MHAFLFWAALAAGFAGQMFDARTTYVILKNGGREKGPLGFLMRWAGYWTVFPVKVLIGISPFIAQLVEPDYLVWAFASTVVAAGGWIPGTYNYRDMRRNGIPLF